MTTRPTSLALLCCALGCASAPASPGFEELRPDFSNVRGLNYIPSYAGSSVGAWSRYDPELVARELGHARRLGANSVRVWLNAWSWMHRPDAFMDAFRHLLGRCESEGLYVMPVLWDSCFGVNPNSETPWLDFDRWVPNPGEAWIRREDRRADFDRYVAAVVEAGRTSPALLMWDVMNEPAGEGIDAWLVHYVELVRNLDPGHPVTIGWAFTPRGSKAAAMVDVVSYHPYGVFRENIRHFTRQARDFAARHGNKPVLATELGAPGAASRYEDVLRHVAEEGVGFMLFEAVIHSHPGYPYRATNGFVYSDGEIRDVEGVRAFRDFAARRGGRVGDPFPAKAPGDPAAVPYYPIDGGFGGPELLDLLRNWKARYGTGRYGRLGPATQAFYAEALTWTYISLAWLDVLQKEEIARATRLREEIQESLKRGDLPAAEAALERQVALAAAVLERAKIGLQD